MRKIEPESIQEEEEIGGGSTKKSREKNTNEISFQI